MRLAATEYAGGAIGGVVTSYLRTNPVVSTVANNDEWAAVAIAAGDILFGERMRGSTPGILRGAADYSIGYLADKVMAEKVLTKTTSLRVTRVLTGTPVQPGNPQPQPVASGLGLGGTFGFEESAA